MGSLLGVAQGSEHEPYLAVMRWNGAPDGAEQQPVAFIGKGVTFDTGGISIKPSQGMEEMKYDMAGSATVVGLMKCLAGRKARVNAIGVVGLVENMPDGKAQRPGDVVTSMSGQTIEVINTDAEGRLVLADVLWYTQATYKPRFMVDLATLTGAIIISLGTYHAGLFSNDDELSEQLIAAGKESGEELWRMPLGERYDKDIDSAIADMKNVGKGREAGSTAGAVFLQRFVNGVPWAPSRHRGHGLDEGQPTTRPCPRAPRATASGCSIGWCARTTRPDARAMVEIAFYQLRRTPLEKALPKLLEKVLESGRRRRGAHRLRGARGGAERGALDLRSGLVSAPRHGAGRPARAPADLSRHRRQQSERRPDRRHGRWPRPGRSRPLRDAASTCSTGPIRRRWRRRAGRLAGAQGTGGFGHLLGAEPGRRMGTASVVGSKHITDRIRADLCVIGAGSARALARKRARSRWAPRSS